jgi:leucyl aminopeptidase
MSDFSNLLRPDKGEAAYSIERVAKADFTDWLAAQSPRARAAVGAARFEGKAGQSVILPADKPDDWSLAYGADNDAGIWELAGVAAVLPEGTYRMAVGSPGAAALGWILTHYRFDRYRATAPAIPQRVLLTSDPAGISEALRLAAATALVRDLVNTPAADMGPAALQGAVAALGLAYDAPVTVTMGAALESDYPMIHAVGRAADRIHVPRLIELEWGNPAHPRVAIIGKGVTFDSGGLNIKPGGSMRLMKKDMGGAAHAIALAQLVIEARLPVRLHLLVAAAENAISGNAFRPGDVLTSRKGLTVEIDNTDAEGRLVLADALTKAGENVPTLMLNFATLTGAARVALGADLPALFCNDDALAADIATAAATADDPLWRLPLWSGYDDMLKSDIADCVNSAEGGLAGAITAALFLRKFVNSDTPWAHLDTFAWRPSPKPGRPKGGEALGLRAMFEMLKRRYPR